MWRMRRMRRKSSAKGENIGWMVSFRCNDVIPADVGTMSFSRSGGFIDRRIEMIIDTLPFGGCVFSHVTYARTTPINANYWHKLVDVIRTILLHNPAAEIVIGVPLRTFGDYGRSFANRRILADERR